MHSRKGQEFESPRCRSGPCCPTDTLAEITVKAVYVENPTNAQIHQIYAPESNAENETQKALEARLRASKLFFCYFLHRPVARARNGCGAAFGAPTSAQVASGAHDGNNGVVAERVLPAPEGVCRRRPKRAQQADGGCPEWLCLHSAPAERHDERRRRGEGRRRVRAARAHALRVRSLPVLPLRPRGAHRARPRRRGRAVRQRQPAPRHGRGARREGAVPVPRR